MVIGELFERLGLKTDAASFAKGALAAKGVEVALAKIGEAARWVTDQLKESTFGVYDQVDGLAKLSQKVGVSAGALQELGYAGDLSAVSMETLAGGLKFLNKNAIDAVNGSKELKDAFKLAKVELTDGDGKLRSTEDVFNDLATRFASMPDSAAKGALAMKIFGKSGAELLPLLNEGADGLAELRKEFRDLHGTADEDFFKNAQQFNDDVSRVKVAYKGIQQTVGEALLPALQEALGSVLDWVRANRALIGVKVKEWVADIVATVKYWIASLREWVKEQGGLDAVVQKAGMYLKAFGVILLSLKVAQFVSSIGNMINVLKVLGVTIKTGLGFAGLVGVIIWTTQQIIENWDDVRAFGLEIFWAIERMWMALSDFFVEFGKDLYAVFVQPWIDAGTEIKDFFSEVFDWIVEKVAWVADKVGAVLDAVNPFGINDTSSSGTRGATVGGSAAEDAAFLAQRQVSDFVVPRVSGGTGARSVSVTSSPNITIVTDPSQSNETIGRIAAQKVAEHNRDMLREAAGGID